MEIRQVHVRPTSLDDAPAVRHVVTAAFGDHGERTAALVDALDASGHTRASLVATAEGRVVGHVQLSHSWLDARDQLVDVLVLSPLSVEPSCQRAGIGTALLAAAILRAEQLAAPLLFLEGSPTYYGSRGFDSAGPLGFDGPSARIPGPAFQVVTLPPWERWMTGRLVYCEPFWAQDCVGLRDPRLAQLEERLAR